MFAAKQEISFEYCYKNIGKATRQRKINNIMRRREREAESEKEGDCP